jgi:hypothetical protein
MKRLNTLSFISVFINALLGRQAQWATLSHRKFCQMRIMFENIVSTLFLAANLQIVLHDNPLILSRGASKSSG